MHSIYVILFISTYIQNKQLTNYMLHELAQKLNKEKKIMLEHAFFM